MANPPTDPQLSRLAEQVGQAFLQRGLTLACAESCTGGWVAKLVTEVAGSSAWFDRGFVTYSNAAKQDMLDVPAELIAAEGAVSEAVVAAMTAGALTHSHADWSLAISGVAGPDGGTASKPVGTVWLAWQCRGRQADTRMQVFDGDRDAVRRTACHAVLQGLLARVDT